MLGSSAGTNGRIDTIIGRYEPGTLLDTLHEINATRASVVNDRNRDLWREVVLDMFGQWTESGHEVYRSVDEAAHARLAAFLGHASQSGDLQPQADIPLIAHTLYALTEFAFVQFVLDPEAERATTMASLEAQVELLIVPYLTS